MYKISVKVKNWETTRRKQARIPRTTGHVTSVNPLSPAPARTNSSSACAHTTVA